MSTNPVDDLRSAVNAHNDWPTEESKANVIYYACRLVDVIDQHAEMIEYMRRNVTPTQEAVRAIMGTLTGPARPAHCQVSAHLSCTHPCCACKSVTP
jgi:hypothetical protein